jgi:4-amino-4-deoxychorismate lyase
MTGRLLAVMGSGVVDAAQPLLTADDLGVLRGDGVFETVLVRNGSPWLLDAHLARLAHSAERLDLAAPPPASWHGLVDSVLAQWPSAEQGALRLVCTRGPEGGGAPTAYATIAGVPAETRRQQIEGVRVVTLSLGLPSNIRQTAPWLLGGVKTTSYAVAMAALREARRRGADDVIWLSAEGDVLEAPTATVVWSTGSTLCTVPVQTGILAGTTTEHLFAEAPPRGYAVDRRPASADDLHDAEAVWLLSAVRGAAPVVSIDGWPRTDAGLTGRIRSLLGLL